MVLLANGGADVSRAGRSGSGSSLHTQASADARGPRLRTRYNRHIRRAAVAVEQCSLVAGGHKGLFLLLHFWQRIRLKLRSESGGSSIPFPYPRRTSFCSFRDLAKAAVVRSRPLVLLPLEVSRHDDVVVSLWFTRTISLKFDLRGPVCDTT